jgi:predicted kinase
MPKVIILQGIPASGKSTWAKKYCQKNKDWVRVNRDDLRNMRGEYWLPKQEDLITRWERQLIQTAIESEYNVIVDSTNLNPKHLKNLKDWLSVSNLVASIEIKTFDITLEEAIHRDATRNDSVGEKVIHEMYNRYIKKSTDTLPKRFIDGLPTCIIVDIDGTLAHSNDRSPYDETKILEDTVDFHVKSVVGAIQVNRNIHTFVFSGRTNACQQDTEQWLQDNYVWYDKIVMRKTGDSRKDFIVKQEMYDAEVKDKYNVLAVFDDRLQVCKMWRANGLKVFQVAEGDF